MTNWTPAGLREALMDLNGGIELTVTEQFGASRRKDPYLVVLGSWDALHRVAAHATLAFLGLKHREMLHYNSPSDGRMVVEKLS